MTRAGNPHSYTFPSLCSPLLNMPTPSCAPSCIIQAKSSWDIQARSGQPPREQNTDSSTLGKGICFSQLPKHSSTSTNMVSGVWLGLQTGVLWCPAKAHRKTTRLIKKDSTPSPSFSQPVYLLGLKATQVLTSSQVEPLQVNTQYYTRLFSSDPIGSLPAKHS